jgi:hypothetical protein
VAHASFMVRAAAEKSADPCPRCTMALPVPEGKRGAGLEAAIANVPEHLVEYEVHIARDQERTITNSERSAIAAVGAAPEAALSPQLTARSPMPPVYLSERSLSHGVQRQLFRHQALSLHRAK